MVDIPGANGVHTYQHLLKNYSNKAIAVAYLACHLNVTNLRQEKLMIIPNANHVDLYDQVNIIPFDKLE